MAKEIRDIIAYEEQQAASQGTLTDIKMRWYNIMRANIDFGVAAGYLGPTLPSDSITALPIDLGKIEDSLMFGKLLKDRRRTLGLTQKELAGNSACQTSTIRAIEAGRRKPSAELAIRLVNALNTTQTEFSEAMSLFRDMHT